MHAYTIKHFYTCKITGNVITHLSHSLSDKPNYYIHNFNTVDLATQYIESEKRDWLLAALELYVNHKKHIIHASNTSTQLKELQVCLQALEHYEGKSTATIAQKFIAGFKWFSAILPSTNNASYTHSVDNLNQIKIFCEGEIKNQSK